MMSISAWLSLLLEVSLFVCLIYTAMLFAVVTVMLIFATAESRHRSRQEQVEDFESPVSSRFTIPVSIVATVFNEEVMVLASVRSLLGQSYAEFEVILVNDGSTDRTLSLLQREYDLEALQVFYRRTLPTKTVRTIYRSRKEPRLVVLGKDPGRDKADALNCGVNIARYRYICSVDGDTVYAPDALLKAMTLVAKDPGSILGAASLFGISREPEAPGGFSLGDRTVDRHLLSNFQHLDLMRSFVAYRLAWSRLDCMLCNPGAFSLWRRDVILEMGGFSRDFSCEDIEMTFRVHERFLREKRPYRILSLPHMVARTEGPDTPSRLVRQRARWQRVILETVWHYRRMFLRPRYRTVGMIGFPYYLFFEALAPLMQGLAFVSLALAIWFSLMNWPTYLTLVGIMVFGTAIPTTVAVALHDASYRDYRLRDIIRLILLGPLDLPLYRPILIYAGFKGLWQFLRGDKGWHKFERNVRAASVTSGAQRSAGE